MKVKRSLATTNLLWVQTPAGARVARVTAVLTAVAYNWVASRGPDRVCLCRFGLETSMTGNLPLLWPALTSTFLASVVEAVEALTIVLAVATVRGWRPAGFGALAGLMVLVVIVVALGPLLGYVPLRLLQLVIGALLLLFGMRWLRKAILRSAGVIRLHDEATAFAVKTAELREQARRKEARLEWLAALTSFKAVLLEGLEVVFIVIAVSA